MAEGINSSASFGQSKSDNEELPIIVAQRFLNIFRQLHIFSDERRESFNKMLLELPPEVKSIFQSLPGGTPLQEYMEDMEQKSKGLEPLTHHSHAKNSNILQEAISEVQQQPGFGGGEGIINGDNFARILASSLAQSNAEIIRELQNTRPVATSKNNGENTNISFDGPMKLIADESFTNIISTALSEAIENSEKKRLEDNRMIAQSFMELQENLTKLIEQNNQVKFISSGDNPGEGVTSLQIKGIVDDLVKAQSFFLKETTQSQKEELSSIIATAIKESQKVSTQALIDSFKKINEEKIPTPITYAATSPKGAQTSMESVEQALKAQGKEFSSIISMALKESQKNSAQTIVETLESLKKDSGLTQNNQSNLKVEEIMRMQANLFRDIARAQNQEFSALISSALKESQHQSTQAIINALGQIQATAVQPVIIPAAVPAAAATSTIATTPTTLTAPAAITATSPMAAQTQTSVSPKTDEISIEAEDTEETTTVIDEPVEETQKKKKKKKKKKNRESEADSTKTVTTPGSATENTDKMVAAPAAPAKTATTMPTETKPETPASVSKETIAPVVAEKTPPSVATEHPLPSQEAQPTQSETPSIEPKPVESKPAESKTPISETLLKLMTASAAFSSASEIKDADPGDDWGWGFGNNNTDSSDNSADSNVLTDYNLQPEIEPVTTYQTNNNAQEQEWDNSTSENADSEEWEWEYEYEEVPADAAVEGAEGEDWEWEYEEVPADAVVEGEEGEDWEWEYEEVPVEEPTDSQEIIPDASFYEPLQAMSDDITQNSEIILDEMPHFILLGLEEEKFRDPYIENNDIIG